jgi:hypothetical protein
MLAIGLVILSSFYLSLTFAIKADACLGEDPHRAFAQGSGVRVGSWGHDTQHNDFQHNDKEHKLIICDFQHNDIQHNVIQHNETQHNDTQHNDIQHNDIQHNDIQHNHTFTLSWMSLC